MNRGNRFNASISATTTLARTQLAGMGALPGQGWFRNIAMKITSIAGGATGFAKLTLGWIDADKHYIVTDEVGLLWDVDSGDATKASFNIDIDKFFVLDDNNKTGNDADFT